MRIVHVTDTFLPRVGGLELHVRDLAARQAALGHDVVVVTTTRAGRGTGCDGPLAVTRLPTGGREATLVRLLRGADVVHCHLSLLSRLAWTAARAATALGVPVLAMVHILLPPVLRHRWRRLAASVGPDVVWGTVSGAAAASLAPAVPGEVRVLPNGIDPAAWSPRPQGAPTTPRGPVTLVASGRLAPRKRVLPLVAVLDEVRRRLDPAVPLRAVIVGDGPLRSLVEWQIDTRGLRGWVDLPGQVSRTRLAEIYAEADIFVAPAKVESFGLAALEARCAGLPVVALARTGITEFVRDGVEGRLARDDDGLAGALAELVTDHPQRDRIAAHNTTIPTTLAWPGILDRCFDLYATAATDRTPAVIRRVPYAPAATG